MSDQVEHGIKKVVVIGGGQMGGGIAQVAAVAGFETVVFDLSAEQIKRCEGMHDKLLARGVEKGKMTQEQATAAQGRLRYTSDLGAAAGGDIVIEAVVENLDVKRQVFAQVLEKFGDTGAILASNTSSISITEMAASVQKAGGDASRFIGMHFFYPVPVMQLVEVIRGLQTSDEVVQKTIALATAMGKTALPANDRAGFVSNRVLMPMINEAFYAWMEGVAKPEDIDGIMKLGCNFPMGPLRLADFIGLDTCAHIMDVLAVGLNSERYRPCPLLRQLVTAGRLGDKSGHGVYEYAKK